MRLNMRIIEAVLHAMCYDVCTVIAPRSVKMHYQLSTNNYRDNKKRATEWALTYAVNNSDTFTDRSADLFTLSKKQDDFADSLLLLLYYLDTYSDVPIKRSFKSFVDEHQDVLMDMYLNFLSSGKFFFENKYQGIKKPATDGVTTAELRNARSDVQLIFFHIRHLMDH
ncbi:MAG: hypothetical protein SGPRY_014750 [Prymnesium sp.]